MQLSSGRFHYSNSCRVNNHFSFSSDMFVLQNYDKSHSHFNPIFKNKKNPQREIILHLCQKVSLCIFRSFFSGSAFLFMAFLITVFFQLPVSYQTLVQTLILPKSFRSELPFLEASAFSASSYLLYT